jgi:hypothetical protein
MFPASSTRADGQDPCWPLTWKSSVPPKVKARNALAREANKRHRRMEVTGICVICGCEQEDSMHAR